MFEGFLTEQVDVGAAVLRVRHGGHGPAVLLLHGHPRTSATWHRVAPRLVAAALTVAEENPEALSAALITFLRR